MTPEEFENRVVAWAEHRSDIQALVLAGSRAKSTATADRLSDWDFHLISNCCEQYYGTRWLGEIASVWCANAERTPRGIIKVSAVFENGFEADFVPLASWQMKLVYWSMRHPEWKTWMPDRLHRGILETRAFLLGSGYRVIIGGKRWVKRLDATQCDWPVKDMGREEFEKHVGAFWQKAVWVLKKIARPELRSGMHWMHMLIVDHVYAMLAEEARTAGRLPRPEARKAEQWLDDKRLKQTAITTSVDQDVLAHALLTELDLFEDVSRSVAAARGFALPDYTPVAKWMRTELAQLLSADGP